MDYPNLAAAVAARYPDASEKTRTQLCHAALHETAHLFVSLLIGVRPYNLRIRRSGGGYIHAHSHDEREILISLAGVAMEFRISGDVTTFSRAAMGDARDAKNWSEHCGIERSGQFAGPIVKDLMQIFGWRDIAPLIEDIATRIVQKARKADGMLDSDKTHELNEWVLERLRVTGLGEELGVLRNRVMPRAA
ncbi:MAG: hypothetical protein AzoDbin1_01062 [Azoarcus sp.]|nr:hypothetical protein [Azoarcus sp.]